MQECVCVCVVCVVCMVSGFRVYLECQRRSGHARVRKEAAGRSYQTQPALRGLHWRRCPGIAVLVHSAWVGQRLTRACPAECALTLLGALPAAAISARVRKQGHAETYLALSAIGQKQRNRPE